jgi:hypothetical protein
MRGSVITERKITVGKPKRKTALVAKRQPSDAEITAYARARERVRDRPCRPEPEVATRPGVVSIDAPHDDPAGQAVAMMDVLASASNAFVNKQLINLSNMFEPGKTLTSDDLGSALAIVAAIEPRNELETALAVQMAMTHQLAASLTFRAGTANTVKAMTEYGNLATKAARTFTAQMDALTKFRTGGKQIVEHRHIYIDNRGGQAVVAEHMTRGAAGNGRQFENQSHALGAPLFGADTSGHSMPSTEGEGSQAVPDARGEGGRS